MSGVWLVIVPVGIIALLFVLNAVRKVGKSMKDLVATSKNLSEVGIGLTDLRDQLKAQRAADDDVPPQ